MLTAGVGLWGGPATGPGERCKLSPSGVPQLPRVLMLLCYQNRITSPAIENPACAVKVSFHTFFNFCQACKSDRGVAGLYIIIANQSAEAE